MVVQLFANVKLECTYQELNYVRALIQTSIDSLKLVTIGVNSSDIEFILDTIAKLEQAREVVYMKLLDAKR